MTKIGLFFQNPLVDHIGVYSDTNEEKNPLLSSIYYVTFMDYMMYCIVFQDTFRRIPDNDPLL